MNRVLTVGDSSVTAVVDDDTDINCFCTNVRRKFHNHIGSGFTVTAFSSSNNVVEINSVFPSVDPSTVV